MKRFVRRMLLMSCGLGSLGQGVPALAQAQVLAVLGHSESLARYLPILNADALKAQAAALTPPASSDGQALTIRRFPVITPELTPGPVAAKTVALPYLKRQVFVVGFDDLSRQWLQRYRERLATIQAVGVVVNIDTAAQFAQLQQEAKVAGVALELSAVPGSTLVKTLALTHYPVLISMHRLEQ